MGAQAARYRVDPEVDWKVTTMVLLETRNLGRNFGGLAAVSDLDLAVDEGEILGLIGPNGAGKSTLLNLGACREKPAGEV